jgi:ABC-type arginine transport system permease subunit
MELILDGINIRNRVTVKYMYTTIIRGVPDVFSCVFWKWEPFLGLKAKMTCT